MRRFVTRLLAAPLSDTLGKVCATGNEGHSSCRACLPECASPLLGGECLASRDGEGGPLVRQSRPLKPGWW